MFHIGIMGAGGIASHMAKALNALKDREGICLYAIGSRSRKKADEFAGLFQVPRAYGSYQDLVNDPKIDLVYIATPHSEHYRCAKMALDAGKNCLVEKAFCANLTQTRALISLAREKNLFLAEAMWTRYMPSAGIIRDKLNSLGCLHSLMAEFSSPMSDVERMVNPALAGGALLDLGVYSLSAAAMYLGHDIKKVKTECQLMDTGVDARDTITLTYKDGTMAILKCSGVNDHNNYARFQGTKGSLVFYPINIPRFVETYDIDGNLLTKEELPLDINGYEYEILQCRDAIEAGQKEASAMPLSETERLMGWMDYIRDHGGVLYPFETKEDMTHSDREVWQAENVYDDTNPWDRSRTRSALEIYDTQTGTRKVLAHFDSCMEAPNWSKDGDHLYINGNGHIYDYHLPTGRCHMVDTGSLNKINNDHVLSSDQKEIAVSDETLAGGSRIYRIPLAGGKPVLAVSKAPSYLHGWSSDMKTLCYCAEREGEYDVYTSDVDGSHEKRLTSAPGLNDGCEFSPDDRYIYFNSVRTGLMQAWRMKADGTDQEQLTFDEDLNTWFPHISPDQTKLVMISYHKGDLWPGDHVPGKEVCLRLLEKGKPVKTLFTLHGGQGTINVNSWSPDSRYFAFVSYTD